jgi:hypothetical protein
MLQYCMYELTVWDGHQFLKNRPWADPADSFVHGQRGLIHVHVDGLRLRLWTVAISGPLVHPPDDIWVGRTTVEWYRWENWRNRRKTYPSATLSTSPTWTDPGAKVGLHGDGLATNCLSNGDLLYMCCVHKQVKYFKCADRQVFPSVNAPFMRHSDSFV